MSGLEEVGVPGPDHLREALTNCTDPLAAIEEFQARIVVVRCGPCKMCIIYLICTAEVSII